MAKGGESHRAFCPLEGLLCAVRRSRGWTADHARSTHHTRQAKQPAPLPDGWGSRRARYSRRRRRRSGGGEVGAHLPHSLVHAHVGAVEHLVDLGCRLCQLAPREVLEVVLHRGQEPARRAHAQGAGWGAGPAGGEWHTAHGTCTHWCWPHQLAPVRADAVRWPVGACGWPPKRPTHCAQRRAPYQPTRQRPSVHTHSRGAQGAPQ